MDSIQIFEQQPLPIMLESFFKKVILGIDVGGGWINASRGEMKRDGNQIILKGEQLHLRKIEGKADYLESNLTINWETNDFMLTGNDKSYPFYTNYKDLPSSVNLMTELQPEQDDPRQFAPLIREEAMTVCIRELVKSACTHNEGLREDMKAGRVIVYAGHPSSEEWEKPAIIEKFREIVTNGVMEAVPEAKGTICMTFPESRAAVFYARDQRGVAINANTPVLVIDMGASTIDLTLIIPNRLIQRDASITLGGRDIDEAFLKKILEQNGLKLDDLDPGSKMALSFSLRGIKEEIYKGGVFHPDYAMEVDLYLTEKRTKSVQVSGATMEAACKNYGGNSFISSLTAFLNNFLDGLDESERNSIQKVVVTGGTANVSHARDAIVEVMKNRCAEFREMQPLIGMNDTNGAVALGCLHLMKNNLKVYVEFEKLLEKLNQALVENGTLSEGFKYRLADAVRKSLLEELYLKVYEPWAASSENESLNQLQNRCNKFYLNKTCKQLMEKCISTAIQKEVFGGEDDGRSKLTDIFNDFFAALDIKVDSATSESIQQTVIKYLEHCARDLSNTMHDRIQTCNKYLNINLNVIDDTMDRVIVIIGGILNAVRNRHSERDYYTQPRYAHTRLILSDGDHRGKALKEYLEESFRKEIDGTLKAFLTEGVEGARRGEHLRDGILKDIQPLLRNAIFMAR